MGRHPLQQNDEKRSFLPQRSHRSCDDESQHEFTTKLHLAGKTRALEKRSKDAREK